MRLKVTSIYVDDQEKALRFYTDVLGFVKKADVTQGPYRWLTVASAEEPDGVELQLAPDDNPAAAAYQQAMFEQGQPAAMFFVDDVQQEYDRMKRARCRVHHAADQGDRLDHRHAQRHDRQPDPDHEARSLDLIRSARPIRAAGVDLGPVTGRRARLRLTGRGCSGRPGPVRPASASAARARSSSLPGRGCERSGHWARRGERSPPRRAVRSSPGCRRDRRPRD